jgi:hypothetical protein
VPASALSDTRSIAEPLAHTNRVTVAVSVPDSVDDAIADAAVLWNRARDRFDISGSFALGQSIANRVVLPVVQCSPHSDGDCFECSLSISGVIVECRRSSVGDRGTLIIAVDFGGERVRTSQWYIAMFGDSVCG